MNKISCDKILEILNKFKNESQYKNIIKIFLYKNEFPVIEINYKNRRFAFDIKPLDNDLYNIKLCWRKGSKQYSTLVRYSKDVLYNEIYALLIKKIDEIVNFINNYGSIKCSVIIPMYNREKLIVPLIKSLNLQTLEREFFEVIFIDDASTDNTVEIVQKLSINFNYRIIKRYISSGSASAPRNDGIKVAYGDYILFINSDDYIAEYTLKDAISYAISNDSDIVYLKLSGINKKITARTFIGNNVDDASIINDYLFNNFSPSKLIKTCIIRDNNIFFDQSLTKGEDKLFIVTCIRFSNKISILRDKDYIFVVWHEKEHLSSKIENNSPFRIYKLWTFGISIIISSSDTRKKIDMFNAWLYRFVRGYYKYLIIREKKQDFLYEIFKTFMKYHEFFDIKKIYIDGKSEILNTINIYNNDPCAGRHIPIKETQVDALLCGHAGSCFIGKIAHLYRNEQEIKSGNRIIVIHEDNSKEVVKSFPKLEIDFKGDCGLVEIHNTVKIKNKIKVFIGKNSFLHLDKDVSADNVSLNLSATNTTMWVGERTWLRTLRCICNAEPNMEIILGKDIIMSLDVLFRPTDGHTIIDMNNNLPINIPKFGIHVNDHVWIGQSVTLLKDANIPKNCVIGAHAVVGKKEFLPNSIIAGIPAKVIKSGITWNKKRIHEYIKSLSI